MATIVVRPHHGKSCMIIDCFDQYFYVKIDESSDYLVISPKNIKLSLDEANTLRLYYNEFIEKNNFCFIEQGKGFWKVVTDHTAKQ